jgi:hypothetical protein
MSNNISYVIEHELADISKSNCNYLYEQINLPVLFSCNK